MFVAARVSKQMLYCHTAQVAAITACSWRRVSQSKCAGGVDTLALLPCALLLAYVACIGVHRLAVGELPLGALQLFYLWLA